MKNKNSYTPTNISMLVLVQLLLMGTWGASAQEGNFGADPDKCKENLSLYREYYKQKNYDDALPGWRWCLFNCPESTKNIFINGPTIIESQLKKHGADPALKKAYLDTLYLVYDKRIEFHPADKGYTLGRKGMDMYDNAEEDYTEAYNTMEESMKTDGLTTDPYVLMKLYLAGMKRLVAKQVELDLLYDLYDRVSTILDHQIKQFAPGTTEDSNSDFKKVMQARSVIDQNFERIAKEDQYVELMAPKVAANPADTALLEKVVTMMTKRKWTGNDLYLNASELLHKMKPSATSAYGLYEGYAGKGKTAESTKYLEEAVKLETNAPDKADKMLTLAKVYGGQKNYAKARSTALEAAALKSGWGEPYLYIGDLYLGTSAQWGDTPCKQKYGIWAAEDMFIKARSVDSSIAAEANQKIASCAKYYPEARDCFFEGIKNGDSVTAGGWIGAETTARIAQ